MRSCLFCHAAPALPSALYYEGSNYFQLWEPQSFLHILPSNSRALCVLLSLQLKMGGAPLHISRPRCSPKTPQALPSVSACLLRRALWTLPWFSLPVPRHRSSFSGFTLFPISGDTVCCCCLLSNFVHMTVLSRLPHVFMPQTGGQIQFLLLTLFLSFLWSTFLLPTVSLHEAPTVILWSSCKVRCFLPVRQVPLTA